MPLQHAVDYINRFASDSEFRGNVFTQDGAQALEKYLLSEGYKFTYDEFEDAYRKVKLSCPDEFEAARVDEVFQCYSLLIS